MKRWQQEKGWPVGLRASNCFVVSGSRSTSRGALLASDPHLQVRPSLHSYSQFYISSQSKKKYSPIPITSVTATYCFLQVGAPNFWYLIGLSTRDGKISMQVPSHMSVHVILGLPTLARVHRFPELRTSSSARILTSPGASPPSAPM
jgi:hypothetical protein